MLITTVQRLESRFEQLLEAYRILRAENAALILERDALFQERQQIRDELDRILARFDQIDEGSP